MKLTGRSLIEFEKWYREGSAPCGWFYKGGDVVHSPSLAMFYKLPESMKYGMYEEFFDGVGVTIEIWAEYTSEYEERLVEFYGILINDDLIEPHQVFKARPEARVKSIDLANERFNNR